MCRIFRECEQIRLREPFDALPVLRCEARGGSRAFARDVDEREKFGGCGCAEGACEGEGVVVGYCFVVPGFFRASANQIETADQSIGDILFPNDHGAYSLRPYHAVGVFQLLEYGGGVVRKVFVNYDMCFRVPFCLCDWAP